MSVALEPFENDIAEAIVRALKKVGRHWDATKWRTTPAGVHRGHLVREINAQRPFYCVRLGEVEDEPQISVGIHRARCPVFVDCVAQGEPLDAEAELVRLVADARYLFANDEELREFTRTNSLIEFRYVGYTPNVDAMDRTGLGVSTIRLEVSWEWTHDVV